MIEQVQSSLDDPLAERAAAIQLRRQFQICRRTDRMFAWLMGLQFLAVVALSVALSSETFNPVARHQGSQLPVALVFGGPLALMPILMAWKQPGRTGTRYTIAVSQVLFSSLIIHVSGGRIESHFHLFGSLAFLAAYRDWKLLCSATLIAAGDHFFRGIYWPESIFGSLGASPWRCVEHIAWIMFEDIFLLIIIGQSTAEMRRTSQQTAQMESQHDQLKDRSDELVRSYEKERAIIEGALDAVVEIDGAGLVVGWNKHAEATFGWTAAQALGQPLAELIVPPEHREAHQRGLQAYRETGVGSVLNRRLEFVGLHREGHTFPIELAITPLHRDRDTTFCAFVRDITSRKSHEEELKRAKEQAETANRTKSEFLANMSHEIRTPLNGILGFTELLLRNADGNDEAERKEFLQTIETSGKHLLQLINDILDLSKIEAGQLQVEHLACSPHQLIAEVISVLRVRALQKGIQLDYRWESPVPETIYSDPHRLRQLLMNLVNNAIKFTQQGSVLLIAELEQDSPEPMLRIDVQDTGIGIAADKLHQIFQPFVQADTSVTRKYGGTGLGLAICKRIALALGGDVTVRSEQGRGSVFTVRIEVGDLHDVQILERPKGPATGDITPNDTTGEDLRNLHVLIADDGEVNRRLVGLYLGRAGVTTAEAENGQIAVEMAEKHQFDAILMDMQMPIMDGYTAARTLRERGYSAPIIALTAHAMKGDREACESAGCSDYLTKPIRMDDLFATLRRACPLGPALQQDLPLTAPSPAGSPSPKGDPIHSSLPVDDSEICSIISGFVAGLHQRIEKMEAALATSNLSELSLLAHALKGAGGTAGFDCFTKPTTEVELYAKLGQKEVIPPLLEQLQQLTRRVVDPLQNGVATRQEFSNA